jgi:hypothetical protein
MKKVNFKIETPDGSLERAAELTVLHKDEIRRLPIESTEVPKTSALPEGARSGDAFFCWAAAGHCDPDDRGDFYFVARGPRREGRRSYPYAHGAAHRDSYRLASASASKRSRVEAPAHRRSHVSLHGHRGDKIGFGTFN